MTPPTNREIEAKVREANYFSQYWGNRYLEHVRREPYDRVHAIALIQRCHWWAKRICTLAAVDKKGSHV